MCLSDKFVRQIQKKNLIMNLRDKKQRNKQKKEKCEEIKMYKNYIFDLYGTLVDIHTNEGKSYLWKKMQIWYGMHGARYEKPLEIKKAFYSLIKEHEEKMGYEDAEIQIEYVFQEMFKSKGIDVSIGIAIETGKMFRMLSLEYIRLYDGVEELLDRLHKNGKKIYLLSNAQRIFTEPEMRSLGIYDKFDGIIYSSDAGVKKPSGKFYDILFKKYNLKKDESIMVGNDHICDAGGSSNYNIHSLYWWTNISPEHPGAKNLPPMCKEIFDISEAF